MQIYDALPYKEKTSHTWEAEASFLWLKKS
jgi:hypothetical protein